MHEIEVDVFWMRHELGFKLMHKIYYRWKAYILDVFEIGIHRGFLSDISINAMIDQVSV